MTPAVKMDLKLRGKRALVTGSSRGIGRAIALSLADFKVNVAINYVRNRARTEETAHEIASLGVRSLVLKGNVTNRTTGSASSVLSATSSSTEPAGESRRAVSSIPKTWPSSRYFHAPSTPL